MNKRFGMLIVIPVCLFFSCATKYAANYDIGLCEVQRPEDFKSPYGQTKLSRSSGSGNFKQLFEDDKMKIVWLVNTKFIVLNFYNKTERTIKIIWDAAAFVDTEGVCRRLIRRGEIPSFDNRQSPTVIMRKGSFSDVIMPVDYGESHGGKFGGMQLYPVLPELEFSKDELTSISKDLLGQKIQLLLPLQIEGVVNEYVFSFIVNDIILDGESLKAQNDFVFPIVAENSDQTAGDDLFSSDFADLISSDTIIDTLETAATYTDSSFADIKAVYHNFLLIYIDDSSLKPGDICAVVRRKENVLIELGKAQVIRRKDNKAALEFRPEDFTSIPDMNDMIKYFK